jgi:hypothetical protein
MEKEDMQRLNKCMQEQQHPSEWASERAAQQPGDKGAATNDKAEKSKTPTSSLHVAASVLNILPRVGFIADISGLRNSAPSMPGSRILRSAMLLLTTRPRDDATPSLTSILVSAVYPISSVLSTHIRQQFNDLQTDKKQAETVMWMHRSRVRYEEGVGSHPALSTRDGGRRVLSKRLWRESMQRAEESVTQCKPVCLKSNNRGL